MEAWNAKLKSGQEKVGTMKVKHEEQMRELRGKFEKELKDLGDMYKKAIKDTELMRCSHRESNAPCKFEH